MDTGLRITWLRRVLIIKITITILIWGLPALLGPMSLLEFLGVPIPDDPMFLRFFGGAAIAWGVAYWFAYKDPPRNVAILKAGLVDNAIPTLAVIYFVITAGLSSVFIWISGILTGLFFFLFLLLMPGEEKTFTGMEPELLGKFKN